MKNKKRIFTLATSHLDTSWLWTLETSINEFIPSTLYDNFKLFEKYPEYRFGFEGSYRYELIEEYYPKAFEKLTEYVKDGRWVPLGSSYENGDVNQPSPEALFRNILYGNDYFEKKFGKPSNDIFLPDCFGFGAALPSVMVHSGLKGFTTQKLTWGSASGTPFDLGKWYGVDGNFVYANIRPGAYSRNLSSVRKNRTIAPKLEENIKNFDLPMTAAFYGMGDRGGAPSEGSVKVITNEVRKNITEDVEVLSSTSVELFEEMDKLSDEQKEKLPSWKKEFLLTDHGAGSYTSRAVGSRWNKRCEVMADMTERALVAANCLSGYEYPQYTMDKAWKRFLAHHFHDDITGTSFNECYERNWNDYILSQNQLAEEYTSANKAISKALDTSFVKGTAVIVNNPTQYERTEAVSALTDIEGPVKVVDGNGKEVPSFNHGSKVTFLATLPPMGSKAYDIQKAEKDYSGETELAVTENTLENKNIKVTLDENGDIVEFFSKKLGKNVLKDKITLSVFDYKGSRVWPAWELTYGELMKKPREYARNPKFEITEHSPVKAVIKVTRTAGKSNFVQYLSLDCESETLGVYNEVDWRSTASLLKVEFPLNPTNEWASYDLGLGFTKRNNNNEKEYEVPAQVWADITEKDGSYGVSVFSDSRTGWDKPDDNTVRLTVVHTPAYAHRWESSQHLMDLGLNRFSFGVFAHEGEVGEKTQTAAGCFNNPMNCFITDIHKGEIKDSYSLAKISDNSVIVRAIKKAQNSDEIVVRFNEGEGKAKKGITFEIGDGIEYAAEALANEKHIGEAKLEYGKLVFDIEPFAVKTFCLKLKTKETNPVITQKSIKLPFNFTFITPNGLKKNDEVYTIPREIIPERIRSGDVNFEIVEGLDNALLCEKQTLSLPEGTKKVALLACSLVGDKTADFLCVEEKHSLTISDYIEAVGAWDLIALKKTGYIKKDILAWNSTHSHLNGNDEAAKHIYLFKYEIPVTCNTLTLPNDKDICIISATALFDDGNFKAANELYDCLEKRDFDYALSKGEWKKAQRAPYEKVLDKVINRRKSLILNVPMAHTRFQIADIYSGINVIKDRFI